MRISHWRSDVCSSDLWGGTHFFRCRWCRDVSAGSLTDRRSQPDYPALARSPIDGPHVLGNHQILQISSWTSSASSAQGRDLAEPGVSSEERSVGNECVSKGRFGWSPIQKKKKN